MLSNELKQYIWSWKQIDVGLFWVLKLKSKLLLSSAIQQSFACFLWIFSYVFKRVMNVILHYVLEVWLWTSIVNEELLSRDCSVFNSMVYKMDFMKGWVMFCFPLQIGKDIPFLSSGIP